MFFFNSESEAVQFAQKRANYEVTQAEHLGELRWAVIVVN